MPKKIYKLKPDNQALDLKINYNEKLNSEQLKVVKQADGPCLVLAGAGSGKTRTLVYRVAYLLEHKIKPDNILLMTFTNKAAKEMLWRVENLLRYRPKGLWGGTFHHIGNLVLRKYISRLGWQNNYTILDESDSHDLIKGIIGEKNLNKNKYFPKARVIKNIISFSLNANLKFTNTVREYFPYLKPEIIPSLEEIKTIYQQKKKQINALDYDDLLIRWLELMQANPDIQSSLAKKFKYILVDEYQDTNHLQARLVEMLASHHGNIIVVGDDAQSIYSFRAADVDNILSFPKKITGTKIYKLETNYRSTPEILRLANASIEHNQNQFPKKLKPVKPNGEKPVLVGLQNSEQQANFICQRIIELTEEGYNLKDIAVLFRADFHAMELELELNKRSIPYIKRGGIKFFEQAHLKDIVAFLKIMHNPQDEISWTRILNLQTGIGRVGSQRIVAAIRGKKLQQISQQSFNFPAQLQKAWENFMPILKKLIQVEPNDISNLIQIILDEFYQLYAETNFDNAVKRLDDIDQLLNFSSHYKSLENFLSDTSLSENFRTDDTTRRDNEPKDYLIISTIHQAKGLEWPVVFVINLTSGQFPHSRSLENEEEIEEERRLFYVAVTRAKTQLYLTYPTVMYNQRFGFIFSQISEFIQELDSQLYNQWQIEDEGDDNLPTVEYT